MKIYIIVLLTIFSFGCTEEENTFSYSISNYEGDLEKVEERVYSDSLYLISQFIINGYSDLMETYNNQLFFIDYQKNKLLKYNPQGKQLGVFLKGVGDGPSELQQPLFMGFDKDDFYIFDRGALAVKTFGGPDNFEFQKTTKVEKPWTKGAYFKNEDFVFTRLNNDNQLDFDFYNLSKNKIQSLDTLSKLFYPVSDADFVYDGFFKSEGDDIFYFMYSNSSFIKFNEEGVEYIEKLIHKIPGPTLIKEGNSTYLNNKVTGVFDAAINKNKLYVLSGIIYASVDDGKISVDVYDRNDGEYISSYLIPKVEENKNLNPQHIDFLNGNLVVLYEESYVSIFEL